MRDITYDTTTIHDLFVYLCAYRVVLTESSAC